MVQHRDGAEAPGSGPTRRFHVSTPERVSTDDLVEVLLRAGARLLAAQDHGVYLEARRHLIFLRRTSAINGIELDDALRAAAIGPGRFDMLLAQLRAEDGPSQPAPPDGASSKM